MEPAIVLSISIGVFVLAVTVFSIYKQHEMLIPDAPELLLTFLAAVRPFLPIVVAKASQH